MRYLTQISVFQTTKVIFHVIGLKCGACGGYNTTRVGGDDPLPEDPTNQLGQLTVNQQVAETDEDTSSQDSWETIYTEEVSVLLTHD